jgi:hypothetical protein
LWRQFLAHSSVHWRFPRTTQLGETLDFILDPLELHWFLNCNKKIQLPINLIKLRFYNLLLALLMAGKKKRVWMYSGSLISPLARYFLKLNVNVNSRDLNGSKIIEYSPNSEILCKILYKPNLNIYNLICKSTISNKRIPLSRQPISA